MGWIGYSRLSAVNKQARVRVCIRESWDFHELLLHSRVIVICKAMAHQYPRSERQLVLEDLVSLIRDGCLPEDRLSLLEHWLPHAGDPTHFVIPLSVTKIPVRPLIENRLLGLMDAAETKGLHFHISIPPEDLCCMADLTIVSQLLYRLFEQVLSQAGSSAGSGIYVTDSDEKCLIEVILPNKNAGIPTADNYFQKYRITPAVESGRSEKLFQVFSKMVEDMNGELHYQFKPEGPVYFRLKLPLC